MRMNFEKLYRRPAWRTGKAASWDLGRSAAAGLVLLGLMLAPPADALPRERAEKPLRLHLVRAKADAKAAAEGGACIRGALYLVRAFDEVSLARGVWLADTLEPAAVVSPGTYSGIAGDGGPTGWQIELGGVGMVLRAPLEGRRGDAQGAILLGRRPSRELAGPCDLAKERLEDGAALARRLRDVYGSPSGQRPLEISVEP